jgi:hypothetical protein
LLLLLLLLILHSHLITAICSSKTHLLLSTSSSLTLLSILSCRCCLLLLNRYHQLLLLLLHAAPRTSWSIFTTINFSMSHNSSELLPPCCIGADLLLHHLQLMQQFALQDTCCYDHEARRAKHPHIVLYQQYAQQAQLLGEILSIAPTFAPS